MLRINDDKKLYALPLILAYLLYSISMQVKKMQIDKTLRLLGVLFLFNAILSVFYNKINDGHLVDGACALLLIFSAFVLA